MGMLVPGFASTTHRGIDETIGGSVRDISVHNHFELIEHHGPISGKSGMAFRVTSQEQWARL